MISHHFDVLLGLNHVLFDLQHFEDDGLHREVGAVAASAYGEVGRVWLRMAGHAVVDVGLPGAVGGLVADRVLSQRAGPNASQRAAALEFLHWRVGFLDVDWAFFWALAVGIAAHVHLGARLAFRAIGSVHIPPPIPADWGRIFLHLHTLRRPLLLAAGHSLPPFQLQGIAWLNLIPGKTGKAVILLRLLFRTRYNSLRNQIAVLFEVSDVGLYLAHFADTVIRIRDESLTLCHSAEFHLLFFRVALRLCWGVAFLACFVDAGDDAVLNYRVIIGLANFQCVGDNVRVFAGRAGVFKGPIVAITKNSTNSILIFYFTYYFILKTLYSLWL